MNAKTVKYAMALGASGALVAGAAGTASPTWAMPVSSNAAAVGRAASSQVINVHYYRRGNYGRGYGRCRCCRGYCGGGYYGWGYGYPYWGYIYPNFYIDNYPYYWPYYYPYSPYGYGWGWW